MGEYEVQPEVDHCEPDQTVQAATRKRPAESGAETGTWASGTSNMTGAESDCHHQTREIVKNSIIYFGPKNKNATACGVQRQGVRELSAERNEKPAPLHGSAARSGVRL